MDFGCLPCLALVDTIRVGIGWIPGTVKPVEIGFVVGYPFLDRLPERLDRLHGVDVEGPKRRAPACVVALRGPRGGRDVAGCDGAEVAGADREQ